jgi:MFS family permease
MPPETSGFRLRVATGCMAIATLFAGSTLLTPLYALYQRNIGFSELVLTLIYGAYLVGNLAALLILGRLSDQVGRRPITLVALAVGIATTIVFVLVHDAAGLFCARALSGFAIGLGSSSATAWLAETYAPGRSDRATRAAVASNMSGLAFGALLSGALAQYLPAPLLTPFFVYLPFLGVAAVLALAARETLKNPKRRLRDLALQPRIGVPRAIRAQFLGAAATAFAVFSLAGFYFALIPTIVREDLQQTNLAIGGGVVFEFGITAMLATLATRRLRSRTAQIAGLVLLLPSLALLVLAQAEGSMALLLGGTCLSGVGAALGFRSSLQIVNEIAPADQRAEVISSYLAVIYLSNALPIIGVGALSSVTGSFIAVLVFAALIALIVSANLIAVLNAPAPGGLQAH